MSVPTIQRHVPVANPAAATSVQASWPVNTTAGDRLLAIVTIEANGVSNIPITPADSAWRVRTPGRIARQSAGVDELVVVVYEMINAPQRLAANPEVFNFGASVFGTLELLRITGSDRTVSDGAVPTSFTGAGLAITVPNTAAATVDCLAILIAANGNPASTQTTPGGWTLVDDVAPASTGTDRQRTDVYSKSVLAGATPGSPNVVISGATNRNEVGIMLMIPDVFSAPTRTVPVQSASRITDTAQTSNSVAWDQPTTPGNRLIMIVATNDESMSVLAGVDEAWGTRVTPPGKVTQQAGGLDVSSIRMFEILNAASRSGTEIVNFDANVYSFMAIIEVAGSSTTIPSDVTSSGVGSGTAIDTGPTPTTSVQDGLALAAYSLNNLATVSPVDPYTPLEVASTNPNTGGNPLTVTSLSPNNGVPGDTITINGTGFTGASAVFFGSISAPNFTVLSDTQISVVVPSGAASGPVKIFSRSGTVISTVTFTASGASPAIAGFSPGGGGAGTAVTITGSNFTGASAVTFNGTPATFTVIDDAHIATTVPSGATNGPITITIGAATASSPSSFSVSSPPAAPTFDPTTPFTPVSGAVGDSITVLGTNLGAITAAQVNGVNAVFTLIDATHVSIVIPAGATTGHVSLTNGGGTTTSTANLNVTTTAGVITLPASRTRPGGEGNGGYCNVFEVDELCRGHYGCIGDVWGPRQTLDRGNMWYSCNRGQTSWSPGRALYASKRPRTKGVFFFGLGAPHGSTDGAGFLGYSKRGTFDMHVLSGAPHGFANATTGTYGTGGAGSGPNGEQVRPNGEMIRGWYDAASDTEYIFSVTPTGVWRYVNGGTDESAITGPTLIAAPSDFPGTNKTTYFVSSCFMNINHFVVVMWDHTTGGVLQPSHIYMMKSGTTGKLTTAPKSDITLTELTPPTRLTNLAEGAHLFKINKGKDGNFYIGCGKGGAYQVALNVDDLTWTHVSIDSGGNEFCDGIVASVFSDSVGNLLVGQCGKQYSKSNDATVGHAIAWGAKTGSGYNWSYPLAAAGAYPNGRMYHPGDGATATGPPFSLFGKSDLTNNGEFVTDVRIDPFDDNILILGGKSGTYMSRQGPAGPYYPAMLGQNGMEVTGPLHHSSASAGAAGVADWTAIGTNDKWRSGFWPATIPSGAGKTLNATGQTTYGPADGCRSGKTIVFTADSAGAPSSLTINGVRVSDAMFEGRVVKPTWISDFEDGTVVIGQFGGGITVVDPTNNPAIPGLS
jgi:hypothetical protein